MQKRGRGGQNAIAATENKDARTYLEPNIDSLQKPIGGLSEQTQRHLRKLPPIATEKRGIEKNRS